MLEFIPGDIVAERTTETVWKVIAYNKGQKIAICELLVEGRCIMRAIPVGNLRLTALDD